MIKVNLVPLDELENQLWWVPDAAVLLLCAGLSFFGAQWYLGEIQKEVDESVARATSLEENAKQLEPEIERFKDLTQKKVVLNEKLDSLKRITVTKISRFEPVIVLEHFQNLKPEGIWFTQLKVGTPKAGVFSLTGQGFDNLLVAEFMTSIRATESQERDDADLRTHIFFSNLTLSRSVVGDAPGRYQELKGFPQFELSGAIRDKGDNALPTGIDPTLSTMGMPPLSSRARDSNMRTRF